MNSKVLVLLDLETTGLDPIKDRILEIGVILIDWELNEIHQEDWVLHIPREEALKLMNPTVRKMHTDNGLLDACEKSDLTLEVAEVLVMRLLEKYLEDSTRFVVVGNSVHFDKLFIKNQMKLLNTLLHYRIIDVSNFSIVAERWTPNKFEAIRKNLKERQQQYKERKIREHRVSYDLDNCLHQLKLYKKLIFKEKPMTDKKEEIHW